MVLPDGPPSLSDSSHSGDYIVIRHAAATVSPQARPISVNAIG